MCHILKFVLNNIELLQDLREKRAKNMQLKISNKELNHLMIDKLNGLFT